MEWYAPGKLLLSSEYVVLDGALALALPCRLGQWLKVKPADSPGIHWTSLDHDGKPWLKTSLEFPFAEPLPAGSSPARKRLPAILQAIEALRPGFWAQAGPVQITTRLEFPRNWGLGSSSTLIALLARWAGVDPFALLERTFGGSGYDLACALADGPLLYRHAAAGPRWVSVPFRPAFAAALYFVHLGRKQDSREGIRQYRRRPPPERTLLDRFDACSLQLLCAGSLPDFEAALRWHEQQIGTLLQMPPVQEARFPDYWGAVKSLGAWGGDFVLATSHRSESATRAYFEKLGYSAVFPYHKMVQVP